jgi:hypothetical protein
MSGILAELERAKKAPQAETVSGKQRMIPWDTESIVIGDGIFR